MYRVLTLLAAAFLCGCGGSNYTLTGRLDAEPGDSLYLLSQYRSDSVLAAGVVGSDSSFVLKGRVAGAELAVLKVMGEHEFSVPAIFLEFGDVQISVSDSGIVVSGTPLNDSLSLLNGKLRELRSAYREMPLDNFSEEREALRSQINNLPVAMAETNADNLFGAYLLEQYLHPTLMTNPDSVGIASMKVRLARFPRVLQDNLALLKLRGELAAVENTQIGSLFTDVSCRDMDGNSVALSALVGPGRWVLLDFWATWCPSCVGEIPFLCEAYAAYHGRGLEIYAVSLDNNTERWRAYVAEKDLPWINVSGVGADKQSVSAVLYAIRTIPANFLISPDGVIVAKNLHGKELQAQLAKQIR